MLVKKNALNKIINKEGKFTHGFKDCKKIKRKASQTLDDLQNLLVKLTAKASPQTQRKCGYFMSFHIV